MKYMGSKNRIAKHLIPIMIAEADKCGVTTWVGPFLGGANLIDKVPTRFKRIGYDINEHVIMALVDIRDNVDKLPTEVSEAEYKSLRGTPPASITSLIRFVCSFGGKFENGYARDRQGNPPRNFASEGVRNSKNNHLIFKEYNLSTIAIKTYKFECVWQGEIKTNFASGRKQATHNAVEKLFKVVAHD